MFSKITSAIASSTQSPFFINHFVNRKTYFTSCIIPSATVCPYVLSSIASTSEGDRDGKNGTSLLITQEYNLLLLLQSHLKLLISLFLYYWWFGTRATASKLCFESTRSETIEKLVIGGSDTSQAPSSKRVSEYENYFR